MQGSLILSMDKVEGLPTKDISDHTSSITPSETTIPSIDPSASVDDYNKAMLQYTLRQTEALTQARDNVLGRHNSDKSYSSGSSVQSNASFIANIAGAGTALLPQPTGPDASSQSPSGVRN